MHTQSTSNLEFEYYFFVFVFQQLADFRDKCSLCFVFDWITIPLVYTQVCCGPNGAGFPSSFLMQTFIVNSSMTSTVHQGLPYHRPSLPPPHPPSFFFFFSSSFLSSLGSGLLTYFCHFLSPLCAQFCHFFNLV